MKAILALLAIVAVVSAIGDNIDYQSSDCSVSYTTNDNAYYYYLGNLSEETYEWLNVTDADGNIWYFNLCPTESLYCPDGSSVCVFNTTTSISTDRGQTSSLLYSDSPLGETSGVEATFGTQDYESVAYKTVIEYVCNYDAEMTVVSINVVDATYAVITVNSSQTCPQSAYVDGSDMQWNDDDDAEGFVFFPFFSFGFIAFFIVSFFITCMCCCCAIRKRRCQMRKAVAMKQFSNVAFQPIPQSQVGIKMPAAQQTVPSFNPYLQPQQFVYYYPEQPKQTAPVVSQQQSDEQLAKQLQAQFDREASRV